MDRVLDNMRKRHDKQLTYMRGMLDGMGFYRALEALEFSARLEEGRVRKDGETPNFHHQLQVARLVSTLLPHCLHPEDTITAAFLHDVLEDHPNVVTRGMLEDQFGHDVTSAIWKLSKKHGGLVKSADTYFGEMARCPIASVVKLADRAHNLHTMQGVFTPTKQEAYVTELDEWFFPMLKEARHRNPRQYGAYENLKILLLCQYEILFHLIEARKGGDPDAT
jgi:(p)ppGpp synthase/HD superfamily hydrolase